jgi:hypothetical protein
MHQSLFSHSPVQSDAVVDYYPCRSDNVRDAPGVGCTVLDDIPLALIGSARAETAGGWQIGYIGRAFPITTFELTTLGLAGGLLYGD